MRASLTSALVAAVSFATSVAATDDSPFWPRGYWHRGFGWVPAIAFGVIGGAIAAGTCLRYQPIHDAWGNYVGRRVTNVCR